MKFVQAIEHIEQSDAFKELPENHYLAHGFCMIQDSMRSPWEVGYYSKKEDIITVFVADEEVLARPPEEAFKKEGVVDRLKPSKVVISLDQALELADTIRLVKCKNEPLMKTMAIVQVLDKKAVWNLTFITQAFNMLNVRVDAHSGNIISDSLSSIMSLGKQI